ncbi:MAG TPA: hypothetical protein VK174_10490 [Chitinophagales bacterium]|nr:hypothetical protein [Chitinophagales bacterium]
MFSLIIYMLIAAIGFMMGFVYKKSYTTAQFFEVNPKKLLRAFMAVFILAVLSTFTLSWFTMHVLKDITIPDDSAMKYKDIKSVMIFLINLFFLVLVVLSNFYSQSSKKLAPVPYMLALGFYVVFILKDAYYISDYYTMWQNSLQLLEGDLPDFHSTGWTKCALAFFVTSFNAVMVWWGLRK